MHLLFLDESGQIERGGLFALGGVAVRDTDWHELKELWQATLSAHGWPLEREVKWHGIRKGEVPPAVADALFDALARAPFTCYVTLLDCELGREQFPEFFGTPEDIYGTGLMFLAERFQHLLEAEDDVGAIVVDSRHREDDARLRRFFSDLTEDGTPYMKLNRIVEGLFLGPSHYSIGLQCADLVVAATAASERGGGDGRRYLRKLTAVRGAPGDRRVGGRGAEAVPRAGPAPAGAPPAVQGLGPYAASTATPYGSNRGSRVTIVSPSASACATSIRSNGSS